MDGREVIPETVENAQAAATPKVRAPGKRASHVKRRARATKDTPCKSGRSIRTPPICDWPEEERPREKLIARGASALSDAELLAVLLRCGTGGLNAIELAQAHIVSFGSLRELLTADFRSWKDKAGVGVARYAALQAALELTKRHLRESLKAGCAVTAPETTRRLLLAELQHRPYEIFCCLYLDSHHRLIAFEELFRGTTEMAHVYIKEVVRQTLHHNACAVIFAHNHPSGVMDPSRADEEITGRLRHVLALMEVRVLDHLIVGNGGCYSFAEHGLL